MRYLSWLVVFLVTAPVILSAGSAQASGGTVMTVVGGGVGDGGAATDASLSAGGIAIDGNGNVYVADYCRVREVSSGTIATVAGTGQCFPYGGDGASATSANVSGAPALDAAGDLYIGDGGNCSIRKVSGGIITTVAGTGACAYYGDGGPATSAALNAPMDIVVDTGTGDLYIADMHNCRVRKVSGGIITTVAGTGTCGYAGDGGPATSAELYWPEGVALDGAGNLYIADTQNCRVRMVSGGTITTIAGSGQCYALDPGDGGPATNAALNQPSGMAVDGTGNLYIADAENFRVREVTGGTITTVAGNGIAAYAGDGGPATSASVQPFALAFDSAGDLYIAGDCAVREVTGGVITRFAGTGPLTGYSVGHCTYGGDGGSAPSAELQNPFGMTAAASGDLYIADRDNCHVRKVSGGIITNVAGTNNCVSSGDTGPAIDASLNHPTSVAVDASGDLYISEVWCGGSNAGGDTSTVRKVSAAAITTIAGGGSCSYSGDNGPASDAALNQPMGLAVDAAGDLYIADSRNCRVRKVSGGTITTIAGTGTCGYSGDGGPATAAELNVPVGLTSDAAGGLYIADSENCRVRKVTAGIISTVAGAGSCASGSPLGDGGPATNAHLYHPAGVAVDGAGNLYIADRDHCRVREVTSGIINTLMGGLICADSGDGGPPLNAGLQSPTGVAVDALANVFVVDQPAGRVREVPSACNASASDPDGDGDTDFCDPRAGLPCQQDHVGDANNDGYSDSDNMTAAGIAACTGLYPPSGGLGGDPTAPCAGRNFLGTPQQIASAKIARSDVDVNGIVNILDLSAAAGVYAQSGFRTASGDKRNEFDQDGNGMINILDLSAMAAQYNKYVPPC